MKYDKIYTERINVQIKLLYFYKISNMRAPFISIPHFNL